MYFFAIPSKDNSIFLAQFFIIFSSCELFLRKVIFDTNQPSKNALTRPISIARLTLRYPESSSHLRPAAKKTEQTRDKWVKWLLGSITHLFDSAQPAVSPLRCLHLQSKSRSGLRIGAQLRVAAPAPPVMGLPAYVVASRCVRASDSARCSIRISRLVRDVAVPDAAAVTGKTKLRRYW